jgi:hypothetical protein
MGYSDERFTWGLTERRPLWASPERSPGQEPSRYQLGKWAIPPPIQPLVALNRVIQVALRIRF